MRQCLAWIIVVLFMTACGASHTELNPSQVSESRAYKAKCGDHWFNAKADFGTDNAIIYLDGDSGPSTAPIKAHVSQTTQPSGKPRYELAFDNHGYLRIAMFQGSWGYGYWRESGSHMEFDMSCQVEAID